MRLFLDALEGAVYTRFPPLAEPTTRFEIGLASAPIALVVVNTTWPIALGPLLDDDGTLLDAGRVEFAAAPVEGGATLFAEDNLLSGGIDIEASADLARALNLGEDWAAADLLDLFATEPESVAIRGQYRWRAGGASTFDYSPLLRITVRNSTFAADFVPGAVVVAGRVYYFPGVSDYTGGTAADLDAATTAGVSAGSIYQVVIDGVLSSWKLQAGTAATDVSLGIIRPVDYHASTNAVNLVRVQGL